MSDKANRTHRKRAILTATCIAGAIVVAGVSAWYWHLRLNADENRLVGLWSNARKNGSRGFLDLEPDRTLRFWTSTTDEQPGTWKVVGDELILTFTNIDHGTPKSPRSFIEYQADRIQNPAAWADYVVTWKLEDISPSTFRGRDDREHAEIVYRRDDSSVPSTRPL